MLKLIRPTAPLALAVLALTTASTSTAVPLPGIGASAEATAMTPGQDSGTLADTGNPTATISNSASGSGSADSFAQATVGGAVRASAVVESASGSGESSTANGTAQWVAQYQTGGVDPGTAIDIDLLLDLDGVLSYNNNNTNVVPGGLVSEVTLRVTLHDIVSGATKDVVVALIAQKRVIAALAFKAIATQTTSKNVAAVVGADQDVISGIA